MADRTVSKPVFYVLMLLQDNIYNITKEDWKFIRDLCNKQIEKMEAEDDCRKILDKEKDLGENST